MPEERTNGTNDSQPVAGGEGPASRDVDLDDEMDHIRAGAPSGATGPNSTDSYRLGYVDGVGACLLSMRAGRSVHQVEAWLRELGSGKWNGTEPPRRL